MYFFLNIKEDIFEEPAKSGTAISGRVLVLNQSYEPVSICSVQKAVVLLFLDKAELIEEDRRRQLRSISANWPFPSIIRLGRYHRVPYKNIMLSRKNILRRDGHRCQYCGTTSTQLTVDHITPRSKGGIDSWENLITACVHCNNKKGSRPLDKTGMTLLSKPRRPSHVSFLLQSVHSIEDPWKPYLFQA